MDGDRHTLSNSLASALAGNTTSIVKGKNIARRSVFSRDNTRLEDISGYLLKKSSKGIYQRRFFTVNNAYLIYKSKQSSKKLDAVIDIRNAVGVNTVDRYGEFRMELIGSSPTAIPTTSPSSPNDDYDDIMSGTTFFYYLKARDMKEATAWVNNIKGRMRYYDKLNSAGQSEVAELWNEEERRSEVTNGGGVGVNVNGDDKRGNGSQKLLNITEDIARYTTNWSIMQDAEDGEVQFEGWLMKKSPSKWVGWQERYCLLTRGVLSYYKNADKGSVAQGGVSMSSVEYIRPYDDSDDCVMFEVKVDTGRVFLFKSETAVLCSAWIQALTSSKHTDAMVQEELEAVRVRALSPQSIIAFDKLGKDDAVREEQTRIELDLLFRKDDPPENTIAACAQCVEYLKGIEQDCRANAKIGKPCRPDVLKHFLMMYVSRMEAEVLPLLEEKNHVLGGNANGHNEIEDVDIEKNYKRAEVLSRKYLGKKSKRVRRTGKESAMAFAGSVDQKMSAIDKWLFGEDIKEEKVSVPGKHGEGGEDQDSVAGENKENNNVVEEDDDPPVLFTLNMSDLRGLISFMYSYHDLITTVNLEYADETFGLNVENRIWPYLAVAIDAYVEGEDGARRQMQNAAQNCLNTQLDLGIHAVDQVKNSVYFTHTPSDLWEMLNAHTNIAGIGEKNNERLQLKIIVAIAGIVNASVKQVVDDTLKNGKNMGSDGWKYICAVVNDCSQHVESLDSVLENIASDSVKSRLEDIFEMLSFSIYESAQRCCSLLISVVFDDLKSHVNELFTEKHDLATIACTVEDYNDDFKAGLQDFYFIKLQGSFIQHTITMYLTQLARVIQKGGDAMKYLNVGTIEEDITQLRECFVPNLKGPSLELPLKVIEDCVRLVCCEGDDIGIIAGKIAHKRGDAFGSSVFECTRIITKMRTDEFGVSKSQTRSNMLREVAEIVTRMAKDGEGNGGGEAMLGREGLIYTNAFPSSNILEKGLESLKAGLGFGSKKFLEEGEEGEDIQEQLEMAEEETFDDNSAAKDHIDVEQVTRDSLMAKSNVGAKRRMTKLIKAGEIATSEAKMQAKGVGVVCHVLDSDMEGWLEKKSPSHNLWQPRYFKLIVNVKDKTKGGEFSWHKRDNADKQNSIFLKDIIESPRIALSKRALVINEKTRMVKLRNKEEDGPAWTDVDCKNDSEGYYEFVVKAKMKKKNREIALRSNDIDVMLSWVNGITFLWRKFTGQYSDGEGEGEDVAKNEDNIQNQKTQVARKIESRPTSSFSMEGIAEEAENSGEEEGSNRVAETMSAPNRVEKEKTPVVGNVRGATLKRPSGGHTRKSKGRMSIALNADTNVDALLVDLGLEKSKEEGRSNSNGGALDMGRIEAAGEYEDERRNVFGGEEQEDEGEDGGEEQQRSTKFVRGKRSSTLLSKKQSASSSEEGRVKGSKEDVILPCCSVI